MKRGRKHSNVVIRSVSFYEGMFGKWASTAPLPLIECSLFDFAFRKKKLLLAFKVCLGCRMGCTNLLPASPLILLTFPSRTEISTVPEEMRMGRTLLDIPSYISLLLAFRREEEHFLWQERSGDVFGFFPLQWPASEAWVLCLLPPPRLGIQQEPTLVCLHLRGLLAMRLQFWFSQHTL